MTTLPQRALLRVDEVAAFYRVSRQAVYRWIREGDVDVTQTPGGTFRIVRESLINMKRRNGSRGRGP